MALFTTDHGKLVAQEHDIERSPHWSSTVKKFLAVNGHCAVCEKSTLWHGIFAHQVHHIHAFHYCVLLGRPDLELDPRNLIVMCQVPGTHHHLLCGHLGEFRSFNPHVVDFVKRYKGWKREAIEADSTYKLAVMHRPKTFDLMTEEEKRTMRKMLDDTLPPDPKIVALLGHTV